MFASRYNGKDGEAGKASVFNDALRNISGLARHSETCLQKMIRVFQAFGEKLRHIAVCRSLFPLVQY